MRRAILSVRSTCNFRSLSYGVDRKIHRSKSTLHAWFPIVPATWSTLQDDCSAKICYPIPATTVGCFWWVQAIRSCRDIRLFSPEFKLLWTKGPLAGFWRKGFGVREKEEREKIPNLAQFRAKDTREVLEKRCF